MPTNKSPKRKDKFYNVAERILSIIIIILLIIVTVIPGGLRLLHRADAQVALGHAKSVRLALQVTGQECYSNNKTFHDASLEGGVAKGIYEEIITLSKAPGDFFILQMSEDGYTVEKFVYREDDYTVWYTRSPKSYEVYYDEQMTGDMSEDSSE